MRAPIAPVAAAAPPVLKLANVRSQEDALSPDAVAAGEGADERDEESKGTALSRRADQAMAYEPLASLSYKHRGSFLAAVAKAADFSHLSPKYRKLLQEAEAAQRAAQRR
jgi:hypothetical protein